MKYIEMCGGGDKIVEYVKIIRDNLEFDPPFGSLPRDYTRMQYVWRDLNTRDNV